MGEVEVAAATKWTGDACVVGGSGSANGDACKSGAGQTESHDQEADGIFQDSNSFEELSLLNLNEGRELGMHLLWMYQEST